MSIKSYFKLFENVPQQNIPSNVDEVNINGENINGENVGVEDVNVINAEVEHKKPTTFLQWLALFLGVLIQPFFTFFRENGELDSIPEIYSNYYYMIFGIIVATIIFPSVYRSTFDTDRPTFLQIIPIFTAGLGWQTMVESIINGATKSTAENSGAFLELVVNQLPLC